MLRVSRKVQRLKQSTGEMEKKASTSSVNERLPELKNASVSKMIHSGQVSVRRGNKSNSTHTAKLASNYDSTIGISIYTNLKELEGPSPKRDGPRRVA